MALEILPREFWIDENDTPWDHIINGKGEFYVCPKRTNLQDATEIVIHYPGADWNSMDFTKDGVIDVKDTVANVRQGHKMYLRGDRGYSYGYGFVVGHDGKILTARGLDYNNAANAGDADHNSKGWNSWSVSIQILVDIDQPANSAQIKAANELIAWICERAPKINSLVWHGFRQYTPCCGPVIDQIKKGLIHLPTNEPLPEPELPDFPELPIQPIIPGKKMITQIVRVKGATFAVVDNGAVGKWWMTDGEQVNHVALNAAKSGSVGVYNFDTGQAIIHEVTERLTMLGLGPVTNCLEPSPNHDGQNLIQLGWDQFGWK